MKKVAFYLLLISGAILLASCPGTWVPPSWRIQYQFTDNGTNAISNLQCDLYHFSSIVETKTSSDMGYVYFNVVETEQDKYKTLDQFLSEFVLTVNDVDGTNNLGRFIATNLIPQITQDKLVIMILSN